MEKSKVVTFRIEESVLSQIDAIAKKHSFFKRSHVIAAGIRLMVELDKRNMSGKALCFDSKFFEVTKLDFDVKRRESSQ